MRSSPDCSSLGGLYLLRRRAARPRAARGSTASCAWRAPAILAAGVLALPGRAPARRGTELAWQPYEEARSRRRWRVGQRVVLDFYADWCLPCKELDEKTFSRPEVAARAGRLRPLQGGPHARATRRARRSAPRFEVVGVPTIAFFRDGREVADARLTGFEPAPEFLKRLASWRQ